LKGLHRLQGGIGLVRHKIITHLGVSVLHPRRVLGAHDDLSRFGAPVHLFEISDQARIPRILRLQLTSSFSLDPFGTVTFHRPPYSGIGSCPLDDWDVKRTLLQASKNYFSHPYPPSHRIPN